MTDQETLLSPAGKVHGSLARAGKVRGQTPKVPKQEKKKKPTGRAMKRIKYNRRFVNVGESGCSWQACLGALGSGRSWCCCCFCCCCCSPGQLPTSPWQQHAHLCQGTQLSHIPYVPLLPRSGWLWQEEGAQQPVNPTADDASQQVRDQQQACGGRLWSPAAAAGWLETHRTHTYSSLAAQHSAGTQSTSAAEELGGGGLRVYEFTRGAAHS
jgi:small subunit ribosomal protein S30e